MFVRAYLRASTEEQDASRAREALATFAHERGIGHGLQRPVDVETRASADLARQG